MMTIPSLLHLECNIRALQAPLPLLNHRAGLDVLLCPVSIQPAQSPNQPYFKAVQLLLQNFAHNISAWSRFGRCVYKCVESTTYTCTHSCSTMY